jgi:hypothetical protein
VEIGGANEARSKVLDDSAARGFHCRLLGRGMGETVRAVTVNGENMLSYSGYLPKKEGR